MSKSYSRQPLSRLWQCAGVSRLWLALLRGGPPGRLLFCRLWRSEMLGGTATSFFVLFLPLIELAFPFVLEGLFTRAGFAGCLLPAAALFVFLFAGDWFVAGPAAVALRRHTREIFAVAA